MELKTKILERQARVSVVGLGYVGMPLACQAIEAGFQVTGYDNDPQRVASIQSGQSPTSDVSEEDLAGALGTGRFQVTDDHAGLADSDVIVICVPTPLKDELPDMTFIEGAGRAVASHLRDDQLIILESTTYPGTTEDLLRPLLETSGKAAGKDFYLGFSPERIDPGNERFTLQNVPKVVGGIDDRSTELMEAFYGTFIDKVVRVTSPRTAEMAKLLENTYRHVNIALVNEIAILCHDLEIDVWEVIEAAATKPFGFQPFYPGPGWGGHCIPVDPAYLSWRVRQLGETARFVELAREINKKMPVYVVQRIGEALNEHGKSIKSAKVLMLGVTYKADVDDVRESPADQILRRLAKSGAQIAFHDPFVETMETYGTVLQRTPLTEETLASNDVVVVVTDHSDYDWSWIVKHSKLILDTRNALRGYTGPIVRL